MEKFRPWLAEFIGTFALIFVGIGAIKTAGHDVLGIALAHGLTIAVFASATMHISGGNLNPAVTFGLLCEIGRASCREREEVVGEGVAKRKKDERGMTRVRTWLADGR